MPKLKSRSNPKREMSGQPGFTKHDQLVEETAEYIHWCFVRSFSSSEKERIGRGKNGAEVTEHFANVPEYSQGKYRQMAEAMLGKPFAEWKREKDRDPDEPERVEL